MNKIEQMLLYLAHEIRHDAVLSERPDGSYNTAKTFNCRFCGGLGTGSIKAVEHEIGCPCLSLLLMEQTPDEPVRS